MHHLKIPLFSHPQQPVHFFPVGVFRTFSLLVLFFLYSSSYAAETTEKMSAQPVLITVSGSAQLYSSDEHFNEQILTGQILTGNHSVLAKSTEDGETVLAITAAPSAVPRSPFRSYARTEEAEPLKIENRSDLSAESTPKTVQYSFMKEQPDSTQLSASAFMMRECGVAPQHQHNEIQASPVSGPRSVPYFHYAEKTPGAFYNNRSFGCHFISLFPVRPPPYPVDSLFHTWQFRSLPE